MQALLQNIAADADQDSIAPLTALVDALRPAKNIAPDPACDHVQALVTLLLEQPA